MTEETSHEPSGTDDEIDGGPDRNESSGDRRNRIVRFVELGSIMLLSLIALVAVVGIYTNASAAINVWFAPAYRPIFQTGFNVVVLGIVGIGISVLLRRRFEK